MVPLLVTVSKDQTVRLWNRDLSELSMASVHKNDTRSVHVGNGSTVITASNVGETLRWPGP